ncbi:hypothetical protein V6N12_022064 [Hibiscus sabdariffa]|uniref:Uncharacterized protein n=1 Tax=Hibiscus sabdariffa TaxID=183260 RepID=A0ABR2FUC1_9ROSI
MRTSGTALLLLLHVDSLPPGTAHTTETCVSRVPPGVCTAIVTTASALASSAITCQLFASTSSPKNGK